MTVRKKTTIVRRRMRIRLVEMDRLVQDCIVLLLPKWRCAHIQGVPQLMSHPKITRHQRRSQGEVLRVLGPPLGPFMGPVLRGPGIA